MANSKSIGVAYEDQAIVAGTIDATVIGATTKAAASFTNLTTTGNASIGDSAADLIAFHGATAVDQTNYTASVTTTYLEGSVSASAIVGLSVGQFSVLVTQMHAIKACLIEKGLMAAS